MLTEIRQQTPYLKFTATHFMQIILIIIPILTHVSAKNQSKLRETFNILDFRPTIKDKKGFII